MTPFDRAIAFVLEAEGGLSENPKDPGGLTRWGISQRAYPLLDIRNLSRENAIAIYRRDYWDRILGDQLPAELAIAVFDCAVNQGISAAIRILQAAAGVDVDGIVGPVTLVAARRVPVVDYLVARALRYVSTSTFDVFGRGWLNRLFALHALITTEGIKQT